MAPGRGSGSRHPSASRGAQGDRLGERKGQVGVFQHWGIAKCRERAKGLSCKPLGEQRPCCGGRSQFEFLARLASIQARASSLVLKPNSVWEIASFVVTSTAKPPSLTEITR